MWPFTPHFGCTMIEHHQRRRGTPDFED